MSESFSAKLAALTSDVEAQTSVIASATTFIQGLSDQLTAALEAAASAGATPEQLEQLTALDDAIKSNTSALATATAANTPGA